MVYTYFQSKSALNDACPSDVDLSRLLIAYRKLVDETLV